MHSHLKSVRKFEVLFVSLVESAVLSLRAKYTPNVLGLRGRSKYSPPFETFQSRPSRDWDTEGEGFSVSTS